MASAPRPDGIPGLLIDEIQLTGIFKTSKHYVAGDQLFDGDVISIGKNEVVFQQVVQNPTGPKPFRDVVMTLDVAS